MSTEQNHITTASHLPCNATAIRTCRFELKLIALSLPSWNALPVPEVIPSPSGLHQCFNAHQTRILFQFGQYCPDSFESVFAFSKARSICNFASFFLNNLSAGFSLIAWITLLPFGAPSHTPRCEGMQVTATSCGAYFLAGPVLKFPPLWGPPLFFSLFYEKAEM